MLRVLTSRDVDLLADGVCRVLERQGFQCDHPAILDAFAQAGASVDADRHVARIPAAVTRRFAEALAAEDKSGWQRQVHVEDRQVIYSGFQPYRSPGRFVPPRPPYMFHNLSTYFHDDETGALRPGNRADFVTLIRLGDVLHPEVGMGHALNLAADAPAPIEPLEAALVLLEHSCHPRGVYVMDMRQVPYLEEVEAIFGIEDPYWHWMANICPTSPLKLDRLAAERYVHMLGTGLYPAKLAAMPVSGVNMPITVGGTVVVIAAEFLALWLVARVLQPRKLPLTGMPILGTLDLACGSVSFTAFDAAIRRFAICDFVRQWTGVRLAPGPGEWTPTKTPGSYCTLEKAHFAMMAAAFTGCHPDIGVGHIDSGLSISPVQLLLDHEYTQALRFLQVPPLRSEDLGLEAIAEVGFGLDHDFLTTDHTIGAMRQSTWMPHCWNRNGWSPQAEAELLARTRARVRELVAQHRPPEVDPAKLAAARAVVQRARQELCR
jgi:trimethylamine:corrinoid methyltransferase-like protein